MAGSEVVAWYKQSVGFGWQAVIRNQASASNPIPQTDCYLSPPFNSCKLRLLSAAGYGGVVVGEYVDFQLQYVCVCICEYKLDCVCKFGHVSTFHQCSPAAGGR